MALDAWGGRIYWNDQGSGHLRSANLDGSDIQNVSPITASSAGVAFDDFGRKVYWTDAWPRVIRRCNPDGTDLQTLVTDGLEYPVAIAIDAVHGKMYWSDHGTQKLQRANLDGSVVQDIATGLSGNCGGIALDPINGRIYWGEGVTNGIIRSANLDGSNAVTILSDLQGLTCVALDRVHGRICWTISGTTGRIYGANLDGTGVQMLYVSPEGWQAWGIALDSGSTPANYCTAKANSHGCTPRIGFVGYPTLAGPDDFHVTATNVLNNQFGIMLWGGASGNTPFHGGTLCLGAPLARTPVQNSLGNPPPDDCSGSYSFHFSQAYIAANFPLGVDSTVYCQYWSRDPGFAPPDNMGLTDAVRFTIAP